MVFKHLLGSKGFIEDWFQIVTRPQHSSILQKIPTSNPNLLLVSHIPVDIEVYFTKLDMSTLEILMHKWLYLNAPTKKETNDKSKT